MWNEIIFVHEIESHLHTRCAGKIIISGIWNVLKRIVFFLLWFAVSMCVCVLYIFIVFFLFVFVDSKLLSLYVQKTYKKAACSFCIRRSLNEQKGKECCGSKRIELMMNWALKYRRDTLINFDKREKHRICIHAWTQRAGGGRQRERKKNRQKWARAFAKATKYEEPIHV